MLSMRRLSAPGVQNALAHPQMIVSLYAGLCAPIVHVCALSVKGVQEEFALASIDRDRSPVFVDEAGSIFK